MSILRVFGFRRVRPFSFDFPVFFCSIQTLRFVEFASSIACPASAPDIRLSFRLSFMYPCILPNFYLEEQNVEVMPFQMVFSCQPRWVLGRGDH